MSPTLTFNGEQVDIEKVREAEEILRDAGVTFDTGTGVASIDKSREWQLDWSLTGATIRRQDYVWEGSYIKDESDKHKDGRVLARTKEDAARLISEYVGIDDWEEHEWEEDQWQRGAYRLHDTEYHLVSVRRISLGEVHR